MKIGVHDDHERSDSCAVADVNVLKRRDGRAVADRDVVSNMEDGPRSCDEVGGHGSRRQAKSIANAQLTAIGIDRWSANQIRLLTDRRARP